MTNNHTSMLKRQMPKKKMPIMDKPKPHRMVEAAPGSTRVTGFFQPPGAQKMNPIKKAEKKLQDVGATIRKTVMGAAKGYKVKRAAADAAYSASPKGKKMKDFVKAGGRI